MPRRTFTTIQSKIVIGVPPARKYNSVSGPQERLARLNNKPRVHARTVISRIDALTAKMAGE